MGLLFKEALATTETPKQERAKKSLHTVYALIGNFFFMGLSAVLLYLLLGRVLLWLLDHASIKEIARSIWEQHYVLVIFYSAGIVMGFLTAFAVILKFLLKLYRFLGITELSKLYFFGELTWLCIQYMVKTPGHEPLPFFVQLLRRLVDL